MGVGNAVNWPDQAGILIPEIWSPKLLVKYYRATVFAAISNTEYEGELKSYGDTVHIRNTPDVTINDYVKGQNLTYETLEPSNTDLVIDKAKTWSFACDDIDKFQSDIDYVNDWMDDAAQQMKIAIDLNILANVYSDASSDNSGSTAGVISGAFDMGATSAPLVLNKDNIVDALVAAGSVLDEQNVPETDRWAVLPAWAVGMLKTSDIKAVDTTGDSTSPLRNGMVGMIDRFTIYSSNQIATTTDSGNTVWNAILGHKSALTFASQLTKNESLPNPNSFGYLHRGLQVYGYKVIKPEAMVHMYARA